MDQTLIYCLIGCVVWAALLYYVFVVRQATDLGAGGRSALVIVLALLIPIIGLALWNQSQSYDRLEQAGFALFPGLGNSVGVAAGNTSNTTWLYSLKAPENNVREFYRQAENHPGWKLTSESADSLVFTNGESTMHLQLGNGNAAFILFSVGETRPEVTNEVRR